WVLRGKCMIHRQNDQAVFRYLPFDLQRLLLLLFGGFKFSFNQLEYAVIVRCRGDLPTFFIPALFGNWRWLINTSSRSRPSVPALHSLGWNGGGLRYSAAANPR